VFRDELLYHHGKALVFGNSCCMPLMATDENMNNIIEYLHAKVVSFLPITQIDVMFLSNVPTETHGQVVLE